MIVLLKPAELLYRAVTRLQRTLYRKGVLKAKRLPRPVISIGNLGFGGAGKTPATIAVVRFLQQRGLRVAVLTRGYGRSDSRATGLVRDVNAGDEPYLIRLHTNVDVLVGANRYDIATEYLRKKDCDVFVLDDGFQHLRLHRDLDVVIDAPARLLREGRSALRHGAVVIPRRVRTVIPGQLRGQRVFAFAGLADNDQFFASLRAAGLTLAGTRRFRDHHLYSAADVAAIKREAGDALVVTTEKDAVKIDDPSILAVRAEFDIAPEVLEQIAAVASRPAERRKRHRKNRVLQRIEYAAYRLVARWVLRTSDAQLDRWGTRLGTLARHIVRRRDALALRNMRAAFPERPARELRRNLDDCWRHFGREILKSVRVQTLPLEEIAARCDFINEHLLEESIARGKGTVLVSAHFGSWEFGGLAMLSRVHNVLTVARPLDNELLERDLQRLRERTGAAIVDRRRAARSLMKGLTENAVLVLLPDQAVQPREGVLVPFLGRPAWTTPAPAKMALRAGATIVFASCIPDGLRHRLEFEESIRVDQLSEEERDPVMLTQKINQMIERRISSRPDLWWWMHDRWKATGESEPTNGV